MTSAGTAVSIWAARGGHGATTVAGALAVIMNLPLESHDSNAIEWLWPGLRRPDGTSEPCVFDGGTAWKALSIAHSRAETVAVLRGPCSLGARSLGRVSGDLDHLVVLREHGRPLRRQDIEAAIGVTVVAEVNVTSRVARLADAGLLTARVADLAEFSELKDWALKRWPGATIAAS